MNKNKDQKGKDTNIHNKIINQHNGARRASKMYSLANFNELNAFNSLLGSENQKDDFVKTKNAGIFMKHNKKGLNSMLKNNLV